MSSSHCLPYNPTMLPRELKQYYISLTEKEISEMLKELNLESLDQLFNHIETNVKFSNSPAIGEALKYDDLITNMKQIASKNKIKTSFIGDGLKHYHQPPLVSAVADIRGLSTAYTPYQPERSQGSLISIWLYSSSLAKLTGFEAINSSMYDRATCLFEALNAGTKMMKDKNTVLVLESLFPGDVEVCKTLAFGTTLNIITVPFNKEKGVTELEAIRQAAKNAEDDLAAVAFPQQNGLGNLEDVHAITDLATELKIKSIAVIDPMLLATNGLVPPSEYGRNKQGATMIVGEGQHLALAPNFGGPGLGIFGVRYNEQDKLSIRNTPGRYVGKGKDEAENEAYTMILSTREQHIRREKASSNICSNQAFIATLAGAGILARGEEGMKKTLITSRKNAEEAAKNLTKCNGVKLSYPNAISFNEFSLDLPVSAETFIKEAAKNNIHVGVSLKERTGKDNQLLICFTDIHTTAELSELYNLFKTQFGESCSFEKLQEIPQEYKRRGSANLPNFDEETLRKYYQTLGELNVSPDEFIYPLGSCTMKYNPYVNDFIANLPEFTNAHPQAPVEDIQGSLQIGYEIQESFKKITGLKAVTTMPMAGAQGELVGIKMFQCYHADKGEGKQRNIILIPHSAHGTNPATATMAGLESKKINGVDYGIKLIEADSNGTIDMNQLKEVVKTYGNRILGVMVTNPNTSGIFETNFKEMSELIHSVGGLVYMDGANMNAIASIVDLEKLGVDAVHNNLHKTWSISHGGGGPGAAIVAVSEKLIDFLPDAQVVKNGNQYQLIRPAKSMGKIHRHYGNYSHNIRCLTYLKALGTDGVKKMSCVAVLSARYLFHKLKDTYPTLPAGTSNVPRMHEFIITLTDELFSRAVDGGTPRPTVIAKLGKLFLDFGMHAPTVAFPEVFGLMIEPTESFTKNELDRFISILKAIHEIVSEAPQVLTGTPHFTPVRKVDEVNANKMVVLSENLTKLPTITKDKITPAKLASMEINEIKKLILA